MYSGESVINEAGSEDEGVQSSFPYGKKAVCRNQYRYADTRILGNASYHSPSFLNQVMPSMLSLMLALSEIRNIICHVHMLSPGMRLKDKAAIKAGHYFMHIYLSNLQHQARKQARMTCYVSYTVGIL